jgi:hypothetical protein
MEMPVNEKIKGPFSSGLASNATFSFTGDDWFCRSALQIRVVFLRAIK